MEVLLFMRSRTRCFARFLELTRDFEQAVSQGDFSQLANFQLQRDAIIKAIGIFDAKLVTEASRWESRSLPEPVSAEVRHLYAESEEMLKVINELDDKIIKQIEEELRKVQSEVTQSRKHRDSLNRFKSTWLSQSGEELDQKL